MRVDPSRSCPTIALTLGDPNGIGPEVLRHALADPEIAAQADYVLYANPEEFERAWALLDGVVPEAKVAPRLVPLASGAEGAALTPGRFDPRRAATQVEAVRQGALAALEGRADALMTTPINKAIFDQGPGRPPAYPGQSELLAEVTGAEDWAMMLAGERLRVVLATTHVPMAELAGALSEALVAHKARVALAFLRERFGFPHPRLAVAALNPHAGDGGLLGAEEETIIGPAVARLRAEGHDVEGPFPSDTLFAKAVQGGWDAVLCMYHDQGLIPLKLVDFGKAVNVTIGLPIVRTSPDHGTGYDIAGQGKANPGAMRAALRLAARLSPRLA